MMNPHAHASLSDRSSSESVAPATQTHAQYQQPSYFGREGLEASHRHYHHHHRVHVELINIHQKRAFNSCRGCDRYL